MMLNDKDSEDSLFHSICYAIRCMWTKKLDKCSNEELKSDLPVGLLSTLNLLKKRTYWISTIKL